MHRAPLNPLLAIVLALTLAGPVSAQPRLERVEPAHWWTGMKNPELQVLLYGEALGGLRAEVDHPGVTVARTVFVANPRYLFAYLHVGPDAAPGRFPLKLRDSAGRVVHTVPYELRARAPGSADRRGYDGSDVLYLITPDRFANGNPANDEVAGMLEGLNRGAAYGRHGGDLQGIIDRLDYLADLGVTAIWLNPVLENNMAQWSYHGYATTDFYRVDPRFGTNDDYARFIAEAGRRGIKVVMDMIANHSGAGHWFVKDPPDAAWINFNNTFVPTNHRRTTVQDIHASAHDRRGFADGWFVRSMPDLNQRHPLFADYLIQNSIWWIEESGIAGIRQDTHPYPDKEFMSRWAAAILAEYPSFSMVGEEWSLSPAIVSYWQRGKRNHDGYVSHMPGMMDFPLNAAVKDALTAPKETHNEGLVRLYEALAHDFLYPAPDDLVIFPDNHDMDRFFTQVNEDYDLFRLGLVYYLTMRGVPQIYYGTEILMHNRGLPGDHGTIRSDFPGGWPGDTVNAFTGAGLTAQQRDAQAFTRKLLNWRKSARSVHAGRTVHFGPDEGTYVYFRQLGDDLVMVALNKRAQPATLATTRFAEMLPQAATGKDVLTGTTHDLRETVTVPARGALVLEISSAR